MFSFVVFCSFRSSDKLSSFCNFPISFLTFQLSVQDNSFLFLIMRFHFLKSLGYWQKNYVSNSNLLSMYCLHYVWFCFFWYYHCLKRVRNRSFSGLYFPAFGLNRNRYSVSLRISPYSVQMWEDIDQKNSRYVHFSRSFYFDTKQRKLWLAKYFGKSYVNF